MKKEGLKGKTWSLLILFGLIGQIAWIIENMYFNVFLYKTVTQNPNVLAAMVASSAIVATVTTLIMGVLSDKWGKRKPFIVYGYIIWGFIIASFSLISTANVESVFPYANVVMLTATIVVVMGCVMTFFGSLANDAAFNAWVTDITNSQNRGRAEGLLSIMPLIALLLVFGVLDGLTRADNWTAFFIIVGAMVTLSGVLGIFILKDKPNIEKTNFDLIYGFRPKNIKENKDLYKVLFLLLLCCIAQQIYFPFILIYIEYNLGISDYAFILAVVLIVAALISIIGGRLVDRFGSKPFYFIFNGIFVVGLILMFLHGIGLSSDSPFFIPSLIGAATLMIGGNMALIMVLNAAVRNYTPPTKRGHFNGIRLIFGVMLPMIIGPFIGARIITEGPTYIDEFGVEQIVPNAALFVGSAVVALLLFIPMVIMIKKLSTKYYD